MEITSIREEEWGIGIRYELKNGFREFVFDKEKLFEDQDVSTLEQLQSKKSDLEGGSLVDLISRNVHKGFATGEKIDSLVDVKILGGINNG